MSLSCTVERWTIQETKKGEALILSGPIIVCRCPTVIDAEVIIRLRDGYLKLLARFDDDHPRDDSEKS